MKAVSSEIQVCSWVIELSHGRARVHRVRQMVRDSWRVFISVRLDQSFNTFNDTIHVSRHGDGR